MQLRLTVSCIVALALAACSDSSTAPSQLLGRTIARDSLTAADGKLLPCCAADSAGRHITTISGALTFHASLHYSDTVETPAGLMSGACVQEVPNGAYVASNGLVTRQDGSTYLLLPCSTGSYDVTLNEELDSGNGSPRMVSVTISSGTFASKPDSLSIEDTAIGNGFSATVSGATIILTGLGHSYQFVAVPSR